VDNGPDGKPLPLWSELMPEGRTIFYEGDDPENFAAEMFNRFGLDVAGDGWCDEYGYQFHCPVELLNQIYMGDYPMGS
jgi:hypothetical protein